MKLNFHPLETKLYLLYLTKLTCGVQSRRTHNMLSSKLPLVSEYYGIAQAVAIYRVILRRVIGVIAGV